MVMNAAAIANLNIGSQNTSLNMSHLFNTSNIIDPLNTSTVNQVPTTKGSKKKKNQQEGKIKA
jgi:hypothetical protein